MQIELEKAKEMFDNFYQEYDSGHHRFTDEDIEMLNWLIKQARKIDRINKECYKTDDTSRMRS